MTHIPRVTAGVVEPVRNDCHNCRISDRHSAGPVYRHYRILMSHTNAGSADAGRPIAAQNPLALRTVSLLLVQGLGGIGKEAKNLGGRLGIQLGIQ